MSAVVLLCITGVLMSGMILGSAVREVTKNMPRERRLLIGWIVFVALSLSLLLPMMYAAPIVRVEMGSTVVVMWLAVTCGIGVGSRL